LIIWFTNRAELWADGRLSIAARFSLDSGKTLSQLLEIARKAGHLPLGTFDRDLAKLDGVVRLQ